MDVKREGVTRKKRIKIAIYTILALGLASVGYWRISLLKPASPSVERATVWVDSVKRGPMVRQVRGLGTLVPEDILWVPAAFDSQVSKLFVKSGGPVSTDTVLMVLTNPDMELAANDLEWQVKQAEANFADLKVQLESKRLDQRVSTAATESELKQAALTKDRDEQMLKMQLKSDLEVKLTVAKWEELTNKLVLEKKRLDIMDESEKAQLDAQKVQIEKLRAAYNLKKQQVAELTIKAGTEGVLQEMTLQVGQRVRPGDVLAKVAQPRKLKAELKIAETQAKDILLGQPAEIDTRNGVIPAIVIRIDPNVVNGTRTVDCKLNGPLPPGAVPDLSVDGTVEIEKLADVLFVGRPVFGQPNSQVGLFKLDADGKGAARVPVKLGRSSVNTIEVVEGLKIGDQVILSDMSAQDQNPRIQLN
jgi:HlyD family secretion protein